jgi:DNA invertase Pin-like site-specific DNA recombinase
METSRRLVGIYTRINSDPGDEKLGVQRQEEDAGKLCKARGWDVVEVFCDNDLSAFNPRKTRPAYQDMLDAVRLGKINTIVAWHPDRLHRQTRELVPFIDLINDHGVRIETVTAGPYDLSTPSGRVAARILGSVAEFESEHKSARIKRKLEENAAKGKHHGGSRPYGWYEDDLGKGKYCSVNPEEAEVVRRATAMLLAGQSLRMITHILNAEGHKTATGKPWRAVGVRDMINRPRNAGLRSRGRQRKDESREDRPFEILGPGGEWESILSAEQFYQVHAYLSNPARRTHPGRDGRVHLLSSLARCGLCGGSLFVGTGKGGTPKSKAERVYRCRRGEVVRSQRFVDDLVTRVILARLALPDAKDLLVDRSQVDKARLAAAEVQHLQDRMKDAAEAYGAGKITMVQLTTINAAIMPGLEKAKAGAASPDRSKVLGDLVGRNPAEVWQEITPDQRRAAVALLVDVTIMPTKKGRGFDPEAIKITWRTS